MNNHLVLVSNIDIFGRIDIPQRIVLVSFARTPIYKTFYDMILQNETIDGSYINKGDEQRVLKQYGRNGFELVKYEDLLSEFNEFKNKLKNRNHDRSKNI